MRLRNRKMVCEKCGKEIPEEKTVCEICNPPEPVIEAGNTTDTIAAQEPVAEVQPFAEPSFDNKKPKRKTGKIIAVIAAVLVVALGVLVAFNFAFVQGLFIKTFLPEETYFKFVEKQALSKHTDSFSVFYGKIMENIANDKIGAEAQVNISLGDDALDLITENVNLDFDLDWLKNISFLLNTNIDGKKQEAGLKFNVGASTLLDLKTYLNMEDGDLFLGIVNLSDKFIGLEDIFSSASNGLSSMASFTISEEMKSALPSEKEFNKLLDKYLDIAVDSLGNVSKTSETIEAGEYAQKVTKLKYDLTEKDVYAMCKEILRELKKDEIIKECINDFEAVMLKEYPDLLEENGFEKGDWYKSFKEAIEDALDNLNEIEGDDEELLTLVDLVNAKHETIGREIEVGGTKVAGYMSVYKGQNFAFQAECEPINLKISGEGTDKNDIVNGVYKVKVSNKELVEIKLDDFNMAMLQEGYLNGNVTLTPSSRLLSEWSDNSFISLLSPAVKFRFENSTEKSDCAITLLSKNEEFLTIALSSKMTDSKKIDLPAQSLSMENSEDVLEWVDSLDLRKLLDALKAAKLPDDILNMLENYVDQIETAGGISALIESYNSMYNDDYGYDYGYDYDYDYSYSYS